MDSPAPSANGNRVTYARPGLSEWYTDGPLGIEQGFTVAHPPADGASGPLTLSMGLRGDLRPVVAAGGQTVLLERGARTILQYGGLVATDARDRSLPARLVLDRGQLQIRVDDRGAVFPLRIDPLVETAKLTASDGAANEEVGASIAVSSDGSTVVAGAPAATISGKTDQGAAYVFVRPPSGWASGTQTAKLTASDGASGDEFGYSVAVSSDGSAVVVGALLAKVGDNPSGAAYVFTKPGSGS